MQPSFPEIYERTPVFLFERIPDFKKSGFSFRARSVCHGSRWIVRFFRSELLYKSISKYKGMFPKDLQEGALFPFPGRYKMRLSLPANRILHMMILYDIKEESFCHFRHWNRVLRVSPPSHPWTPLWRSRSASRTSPLPWQSALRCTLQRHC